MATEPALHTAAPLPTLGLLGKKRVIGAGDPVVVYGNRNHIEVIWVTPGKVYDSRMGHYPHNNMIGIEYGSKMYSKDNSNFVYLMKPTPELWTLALHHRTEILYATDIALVLLFLELQPGSIVIESGTGSGSLSTAIARTIAPEGHLYTYEFHPGRAESAREDFKQHHLNDLITVTHRDVCADGFTLPPFSADAVFLDLPSPWLALEHAFNSLKPNKRICSFSPCIEQVQRTCEAMEKIGFLDIVTVEVLARPYEVAPLDSFLQTREEKTNARKRRREALREAENDASLLGSPSAGMIIAKPVQSIRGHTGYLTFARTKL